MFEDRKIIKLTRSYTVHGETFDSVTLRAPKLKDLMAIGEPYERQQDLTIEYTDRLQAYVDRCATAPTSEALNDISLPDAILVKEAMSDFFISARKIISPAPINSSSD